MNASLWRRTDLVASAVTPVGMTLLLAFIGMAHSHIPGYAAVAPVLPFAAIYFWSVYRPGLMPVLAVFSVGLLFDLLSGGPPGLFAVVFMTVRLVTVSQRRFFIGKPFLMVWWGFMMITAGAALFAWLLASITLGRPLISWAPVFQFFLGVGLYPLISWLLVKADAGLVQVEE